MIETDYSGTLRGQFLIAMPGLMDPNFAQTVICICEHTDEGAVGLVINRVHNGISGKDIFEELGMEYTPKSAASPIHMGGPVHPGEIFLLHGPPFHWESCLAITPTLGMSNTRDALEAIAMGRGPSDAIIVIGCAGWGSGQLENEIMENAWLNFPVSEDIVFEVNIEKRWEASVRKMGIDPALLSDKAGRA